jgi:hypothetical protein
LGIRVSEGVQGKSKGSRESANEYDRIGTIRKQGREKTQPRGELGKAIKIQHVIGRKTKWAMPKTN